MESKICPKCGKQLSEDAILCTSCGYVLAEREDKTEMIKTDSEQLEKEDVLLEQQTQENNWEEEKPKKKKRIPLWPFFLIFVAAILLVAVNLFMADAEGNTWLKSMWYEITGQKSSATVNTNDVAEMQLDVYDYYGKPISNLTDKIGQPLKMSEKLDAETGQVTEYDFGLFIAEVNQSNMVQRITIYFYALNDPSVIRLYHINGTHNYRDLVNINGNPFLGNENTTEVYYYPADKVAVEYEMENGVPAVASVYTDETNGQDLQQPTDETTVEKVEVTDWLGRYNAAIEAFIGAQGIEMEDEDGGHSYTYSYGLTVKTNADKLISRIEVDFTKLENKDMFLFNGLDGNNNKQTVMNATRDYATLEGDSLILTKNNIRYTYTFDEENQLIKAVAETI